MSGTSRRAGRGSARLLVSVGNTRVAWALDEVGRRLGVRSVRLEVVRAGGLPRAMRRSILRLPPPREVRLVSVNPPALARIETSLRRLGARALVAVRDLVPPLVVRGRLAKTAGADRLANAAAASVLARGRPAVAIDAGTAVTVDVVTADGEFAGGAILPGLRLGARALARGCALLPFVEPRGTSRAVGRDTVEAIRAGIVLGTAGAIERLVAEATNRLGRRPAVFVTGGDGPLLARRLRLRARAVPDLTLRGLELFAERPAARGRRRAPRPGRPDSPRPALRGGGSSASRRRRTVLE